MKKKLNYALENISLKKLFVMFQILSLKNKKKIECIELLNLTSFFMTLSFIQAYDNVVLEKMSLEKDICM